MRIGGSQAITRLTSLPVNSLISLVVETAEDEIDIITLQKGLRSKKSSNYNNVKWLQSSTFA
jgi:hypothetical protein